MRRPSFFSVSEADRRRFYPLALLPRAFAGEIGGWRFALDPPEIIRDRLAWLAAFVPCFGVSAWASAEADRACPENAPHAIRTVSGDTWSDFHHGAYETGWVDQEAHWSSWKETPEARRFQDNFEVEARRATPLQIHQLITTICRSDRFSDGQIDACFTNGWFEALFIRAAVLLATDYAAAA
jgi:hypothetical protein